jgi:uncharacterized membrane protein HdeD (DUF308 family)
MPTDISDRTDSPTLGPPDRPDLPPWGPLGPVLRQEAGRWWWLPLLAGVAWFGVAWLVLRADLASLATVGVLIGVVFLIAAVNEAALGAWMTGGWKLAHYLMSAVFVLGGVWAFVRPIDTFFALAWVLGLLLFLQGSFYIIRGVALRGVSPYWGLEVVSGVLITALAIWVSASDQVWDLRERTVFILLWVGLMAVFRGISDIALAFSMAWFAKRGDRGAPKRQADGTTPRIPGQERRAPAEAARPERPEAPSASRG